MIEVEVVKVRPPKLWGKAYAVGVARDGRIIKFDPSDRGELYMESVRAIKQGFLVRYGVGEDRILEVLGHTETDWKYDVGNLPPF